MARGGNREGAGRKPDPNSKRQQALARKAAKAAKAAGATDAPPARKGGFTLPNGQKSPDAPAGWPFGTEPPAAEALPAAPPAPDRILTAREYLSQLVNDLSQDNKMRLDAAKKLIEFEEAKPAPMGKKEAKAAAAKTVASKFSATKAPLALVKR